MPTFEIKNLYDNIIWKCEAENFKDAVATAISQNINLQNANFCWANLQGANLQGANLEEANLEEANLQGANLQGANLFKANLWGVNFQWANLQGANLRGAIFRGAILRGADLREADLRGANLQEADLQEANLQGANLQYAFLLGAIVDDIYLADFQIPQRKSLIVYKKLEHDAIATLRIPSGVARTASLLSSSPQMRAEGKFGKCRAERAFVVAIEDQEGKQISEGKSVHNSFIYKVGKEVRPEQNYDPDIRIKCTSGIHFFMTKEEAKEYKVI
jgi:hypothetical protein